MMHIKFMVLSFIAICMYMVAWGWFEEIEFIPLRVLGSLGFALFITFLLKDLVFIREYIELSRLAEEGKKEKEETEERTKIIIAKR